MTLRSWAVVVVAAVIAVVSAKPYAGGWNDGSRLATVEALVDHGTWSIGDSVFVRPAAEAGVYPPDDPALDYGTLDKLLIDGRYYSDKSPVPAVFMAGEYAVLKAITGWTAAAKPARFCWCLCLLPSGLPGSSHIGAGSPDSFRSRRRRCRSSPCTTRSITGSAAPSARRTPTSNTCSGPAARSAPPTPPAVGRTRRSGTSSSTRSA